MENKTTNHNSFSVVIETENLGLAGLEDLEACLNTLENQTFPIERANEVLVIAGSHLSKEAQDRLEKEFPWIAFHPVNENLTYTGAKRAGAQMATGEIMVFADSDVRYETTWLESLLTLFETHPDATVAGGNTRLSTESSYTMALNLTWMIHIYPKNQPPRLNSRFQLNNFAIKRSVMLSVPFPTDLPLYRGDVRVWKERLLAKGHKFYSVTGASAIHPPPGSLVDYWYRMLVFGSDAVAKADFTFTDTGEMVEKRSFLKRLFYVGRLGWARIQQFFTGAYVLISEDFRAIIPIVLGLPIAIISNFVIILGGLIALFDREFVLRKIKEREDKHIV